MLMQTPQEDPASSPLGRGLLCEVITNRFIFHPQIDTMYHAKTGSIELDCGLIVALEGRRSNRLTSLSCLGWGPEGRWRKLQLVVILSSRLLPAKKGSRSPN